MDESYVFEISLQNWKRISIHSIFSILLGMERGSATKLFRHLPVVICEQSDLMVQEIVIPSNPSLVQALFLTVYKIFLF